MPGADDNNTNNNPNPGDADKNKNNQNPNPGDKGGGDPGADDNNEMSPEDMKKVIADLRKENAAHRTKGKSQEDSIAKLSEKLGQISKHLGLKDEEADPAVQVKELTSKTEALELELSLNQLARENGIPVEHDEYFRFLIGKKFAALEESGKEDEELSAEQIAEVVEEVKKYSGFKATKPNGNQTGVDEGGGKKPAGGGDSMTPEQFAKLNYNEKTKLFTDNKAEYDRLYKAAKEKRLI